MRVYREGISDFEAWDGAMDAWARIKHEGKTDALESALEDLYPDGISEGDLNDLLWHDSEWTLGLVGIDEDDDDEEDNDDDGEEDDDNDDDE